MDLVLRRTKNKILKVQVPSKKNGAKVLKLNVKPLIINKATLSHDKMQVSQKDFQEGKINLADHLFGSIKVMTDDLKRSDFDELEVDHVNAIVVALTKLQMGKDVDPKEKKNQ